MSNKIKWGCRLLVEMSLVTLPAGCYVLGIDAKEYNQRGYPTVPMSLTADAYHQLSELSLVTSPKCVEAGLEVLLDVHYPFQLLLVEQIWGLVEAGTFSHRFSRLTLLSITRVSAVTVTHDQPA